MRGGGEAFAKKRYEQIPMYQLHADGVILHSTNYGRPGGRRFAPQKFRVPSTGIYTIRVKGYGISPTGAPVIVGLDKGKTIHTFFPKGLQRVADIRFDLDEMETHEFVTHLDAGSSISLRFVNGTGNRAGSIPHNSVLLHSMDLEGPLSGTWPPESTQVVTSAKLRGFEDLTEPTKKFLFRAYRRPVTEVERFRDSQSTIPELLA